MYALLDSGLPEDGMIDMPSGTMPAYDLVKRKLLRRWRAIAAGLASLMVVDLLQLTIPRIIKKAVDDIAMPGADGTHLGRYALILMLMALAIAVFRYCWRRCLLGTARYVEEALRNRLFGFLQGMSPAFFDTITTGDIMAYATNDIQQVRMAIGMGMVALNDALFLGAAAVGFMLYIDVELTCYVMLPMPLIVISSRVLGNRMHRSYQRVQAAFAAMTEAVRQRLAAIRLIKAHGLYGQASADVDRSSGDYVRRNVELVRISGLFFPLMLLFTNLSLALVLWLGGRRTMVGRITPGDFVAFLHYLGLMTWPMMALGWVINLVQRGKASLDRLNEVMRTRPQVEQPPQPVSPGPCKGTIDFQAVEFSYPGRRRPAVTGISFRVEPGQVLGLVGPPGSGKTTVLNLIMRHYDVCYGKILIDGFDLRHLSLEWIRDALAWVSQEPFIFAGTIRENLTLGKGGITKRRLEQVLASAALEETIAQLPNGLETLVGEKGVILSGGQKQRLALARALLKDSPVLLLDDPVSQVDAATAHHLVQTLRGLAGSKTMLIASHRVAAVSFADNIVCLEQGRIADTGNHSQLVDSGGYYGRIALLQESNHAF